MSGHHEQLHIEEIGGVTVVDFAGKKILDEPAAQAIAEQLLSLVDKSSRKRMLLNFAHVEYLSSAFLGKLIILNKKIKSAGGRLALCNMDPRPYEVFEVAKLNQQFRIVRDRGEDDSDENWGGVMARLLPPKPSDGGAVTLQPPLPEWEE